MGFYGDEGVDAGEGFASNGESGVGGGQDLAAVGVEFNHVQGFVAGPSGGGEAAQQGFAHVAAADDLQSCVHVEESTGYQRPRTNVNPVALLVSSHFPDR